MKKISLFLVVVMILSLALTACGNDAPPSGKLDEAPKQEATVAATEPPATERPVTVGRMEGGIYTNEYAGFGVQLDSNWSFLTAEELQEMPENLDEALSQIDGASSIPQIMDMQAENLTDYTSMNVLYQELNMQQRLVFATMTEEDVVDETLKTQDQIIAAYATSGIDVESMEKVVVNFCGEEHYAIHTVSTFQGVPYYILQIMDYSLGRYSVTLTVGSFLEDNTLALLDLFYPVG